MRHTLIFASAILALTTGTAYAECECDAQSLSSPTGDRGGGGTSSSSPTKYESSSQRGRDPFNDPDISAPGDGMTGGDAYYFVQPEPRPTFPPFYWRGLNAGADTVEYSLDEVKAYLFD